MAQPPPDLYNIRNTHKLFFACSLALTGSLVWMVWHDYDREWKRIQRDHNRIEHALLDREIAAEAKRVAEAKEQSNLEQKLADARESRRAGRDELAKAEHALHEADGAFYNADRRYKDRKSEYDSIRYFYNEAKHHLDVLPPGDPHRSGAEREYDKRREELEDAERDLEAFKKDAEQAEAALNAARAAADAVHARLDAAEELAKSLDAGLVTLRKRAAKVDPANPLYLGRNAPGIDFIDPTLKVDQKLLPHIPEDLNFVKVGKVDRCHTCHRGIDNPNYAASFGPRNIAVPGPDGKPAEREVTDWHFNDPALQQAVEDVFGGDPARKDTMVKVLRAHPRLDLYMSSGSPHPLDKVGCTVCHEGDGRSLSFVTAAHTADDAKQAAEWKARYHWHPMHHWDAPMLARRHLQASCNKCHRQQAEIAGADRWQTGRRLVERVGCFGCHKTENFELRSPDRPDGERKTGPALDRIADKVTREWAYHWIANPRDFRPSTRMPRIFGHVNTAEFGDDDVQVGAVVEYLFLTSSSGSGYETPPGPGDAEKGKQVVEKRGCLACHRVGVPADDPEVDRFVRLEAFGPALDGVGSKVAFNWLYNWIRNPERYFPDTKMPNLRLSKEEAADAAAYLMTLRNEAFEKKAAGLPAADDEKLAKLAREFLEAKHPSYQVQDGKGTWRSLLTAEVWEAAKRRENAAGPVLDLIAGLAAKADRDAAQGIFQSALDAIRYEDAPAAAAAKIGEIRQALAAHFPGDRARALEDACAKLAADLARLRAGLEKLPPVRWTQLYVGERVINRQGCFGCHDGIRGFEKAVPIGVELSGKQAIGSKDILRFDFGYAGLTEHTREAWLKAKLLDPRQFDLGQRKTREEKLRMPAFGFTEAEAEAIVTFLAGLTNVEYPAEVVRTLSTTERDIEKGRRLVIRNNCRACHAFQMEQVTVQHEAADGKRVPVTIHGLVTDEDADKVYVELWRDEVRLGLRAADKYNTARGNVVRRVPLEGGGILDQLAAAYVQKKMDDEGEEVSLAAGRNASRLLAPPILYGEGGKVQADWLVRFLRNPAPIRPSYADTYRMPTFGFTEEEAVAIVKYFYGLNAGDVAVTRDGFRVAGRKTQQTDELVRIQVERGEDVDLKRVEIASLSAEDAAPLRAFAEFEPGWSDEVLGRSPNPLALVKSAMENPARTDICGACHRIGSYQPQQPPDKLGPNLLDVKHRLRPDWVRRWVADPKRIYPGTTMLSFPWGSEEYRQAHPQFYPGDAAKQVEAVSDYLFNRKQDPAPPAAAPPPAKPGG
jgi:cbb3-type cytochrome oxidase cytochrome c subunit